MKPAFHRARHLWLGPERVLSPGEIVVQNGRVVAVRRATSARVPNRLMLPSLVNAHVHLQIPALPRQRRGFVPWIRAVLRQRADPSVAVEHAASALHHMLGDGVAAVGEIDSSGSSPAVLAAVGRGVGGRCYQEVLGFDLGAAASRRLLHSRRVSATRHCRFGWSPHAPYSVSPALLRAVRASAEPRTIHVAESIEELQFLRQGTGPFRQLLEDLGRLPMGYQPLRCAPIEWLEQQKLLGPKTLLVHAQHINHHEEQCIARRRAPIVVCPGTIRYFRRQAPPVRRWLDLGIPVALGTDSAASNEEFSCWADLVLAARLWPTLTPEELLTMATAAGGVALSRPWAGRLRVGGPANFLSVPLEAAACSESVRGAIEQLVMAGTAGRRRVWLHGQEV